MRLRVRRIVIVGYVLFCSTLSFLNYRYAGIRYQYLDEDDLVTEDRSTQLTNFSETVTNSSKIRTSFWKWGKKVTKISHKLAAMAAAVSLVKPKSDWDVLWPEGNPNSDRILEQIYYQPKKLKNKTIIIYLPHGRRSWNVRIGAHVFVENKCSVQNCLLTDLHSSAATADAVMFRQNIYRELTYRPIDQIWILYSLESPFNSGSYKMFDGEVNWTATYRMDSDLVTPYERIAPTKQGMSSESVFDYSKAKTKMVAWFVSNCHSANSRMNYAKALSEHIEVDIYGTCGKQQCSRYDPACFQMLDKYYRFYLSFENSNCKHYVTEKFFLNGLQHDIIPIVMGASKEFYTAIAPPHSFIAVSDFETPKSLAEYLNYLSSNTTAYNEYFQWKGAYRFINTKFWCRLCTLLNEPKQKVYDDLEDWWRNGKVCITPEWKLD